MTICRVAFVLMCFSPQLRYLVPQVGIAALLVGMVLGYVSLAQYRVSMTAIFFGTYFIAFGALGLVVQLMGDIAPGMPHSRPLFFYALTALALVLTGLSIIQRDNGGEFVLRVLCLLLIAEVAIVGLQFTHMSFGIGLSSSEDAGRDLLIEGSYGNPNNVALVLAMLLMVLIMSGYLQVSLFGASVVMLTLGATFVTLSRTALVFLVVFLLVALLAPRLQRLSVSVFMQGTRRLVAVLALLVVCVLLAQRSGVLSSFEDLAIVERSLVRVATLSVLDQDTSVEFRAVVASRFLESLDSLGFGTLSDRSYGEFFRPLDPPLAAINPHSYVAEMAFLFGYPGLLMALVFLSVAIGRIVLVRYSRRFLLFLFGFSVLFFQMVPSSVFGLDIFFLLIVIAGTRSLQISPRRSSVGRSGILRSGSQDIQS